jgi:hypothetical protein
LLATAHFGEVGVIKRMFQGVHRVEHAVSLGRRLAAVFVAMLVVSLMTAVIDALWTVFVIYPLASVAAEMRTSFTRVPYIFFSTWILVMEVGLLWMILWWWRKRQNRGERLWFEVMKPVSLAGVVCGVLLVHAAVVWLRVAGFDSIYHSEAIRFAYRGGSPPAFSMVVMGWTCECVSCVMQALLWIWWSDKAPRTRRGFVVTAVCWVVATRLVAVVFQSVGYFSMAGRIDGPSIMRFVSSIEHSMGLNLAVEALLGMLALVVYRAVMRSRQTTFTHG